MRVSTLMYNEFLTSLFETNDVVHNKQIENKKPFLYNSSSSTRILIRCGVNF